MDPQQPSLTMVGPDQEQVKKLIQDAIMAYRQADPERPEYEMASQFLKAAQAHLTTNPKLAGAMADKAYGLFSSMAPKAAPQDTGLVGMLKPFLGQR